MAELRRSNEISILETLKSFNVGDTLSFSFSDVGVNSVSSIRTMISRYKNDGRLEQNVKYSIHEFENPQRIFILRTR